MTQREDVGPNMNSPNAPSHLKSLIGKTKGDYTIEYFTDEGKAVVRHGTSSQTDEWDEDELRDNGFHVNNS